ncbi:calcium-binding protein [Zhengella sp. ZM62]|uniref:calcium-binding protein n=1 Tax=Zhengella sedimenti TaxID=3390035 RepID=UPI003977162E
MTENIIDGQIVINSDQVLELTGDIFIQYGAGIEFHVASDGSSCGFVQHSSGVLTGPEFDVTIVADGNYSFINGDRYTIFQTDGTFLLDFGEFDSEVRVTGQDSGFGFYIQQSNNNIDFVALNNGDGTGIADVDMGSTSQNGGYIYYNTTTEIGGISGGDLEYCWVFNIQSVHGTDANDTFIIIGAEYFAGYGRGGTDSMVGNSGGNYFDGGDGNDLIFGGAGNDALLGGDGNDLVIGGTGADTLSGGSGYDTLGYNGSSGAVYVFLGGNAATGGDATGDTISGFENVIGSAFDDRLFGSAQVNLLDGGAGSDIMLGNNGNDTLRGREGRDILYGGNQNDRFVYFDISDTGLLFADRDRIQDFGNGEDVIDLSALDADTNTGGDQAFIYVGSTFTGSAGQLRSWELGGLTFIEGDVNGDGMADFRIELLGTGFGIDATDFVL